MLRLFELFGLSIASNTDVYHLQEPGFSKVCQEAIGMTAMSKIGSTSMGSLKRLLGNKDAVDVVHWGNKVAKRYPATESYHHNTIKYIAEELKTQEFPKCADLTKEIITNCTKKDCLLNTLTHFYVRLAYPDRADEFPLTYPNDMEFTDVDALKLVINLMTEIHNPMAFMMEGETNPKLVKGRVAVNNSTDIATNLYEIGRGQICDIYSLSDPTFWNGGWTHHQGLGDRFVRSTNTEFGTTLESNIEAIKDWAIETAKMRCVLMDQMGNDFDIKGKDIGTIFRTKYRRLVLAGGIRMAAVIRKILDVQKNSTLRKSSGIDVPVEISYGKQLPSKLAVSSGNVFSTFLVNAVVISVVISLGWFFLIRDPNAELSTYGEAAKGGGSPPPQSYGAQGGPSAFSVTGGAVGRGKDRHD